MPSADALKAELKVRDAVKRALTDRFGEDSVEVAHSFQALRWLDREGVYKRNELDVVAMWRDAQQVTHLAAIEVKSYNTLRIEGARWIVAKPVDDPFEQVEEAAKTVQAFLKDHKVGAERNGNVHTVKFVALPNLSRDKAPAIIERIANFDRAFLKEEIADTELLGDLLVHLSERFHQKRVDFDKARPILRRNCFIPADPKHLSTVLEDLARESAEGCSLTARLITRNEQRMIIEGPAGTGKTVVAAESALLLAAERRDHQVLLLTFHEHLADHVARAIAAGRSEDNPNLLTGTPESVLPRLGTDLGEVLQRAGLVADIQRDYLRDPAFYTALAAILDGRVPIYAVLVDEGQDFDPAALSAMQDLLVDDGRLLIFADPLQRTREDVASVMWRPPVFDPVRFPRASDPWPLDRNWRNTNTIGTWVRDNVLTRFGRHRNSDHTYRSFRAVHENEIEVGAPDRSLTEADLLARLDQVLLLNKVNRDSTVVLVQDPTQLPDSIIAKIDEYGVVLRSIDSIRGLEADVVVLLSAPLNMQSPVAVSAAYVGATRARAALYVLEYKLPAEGS